MMRLPSSQRTAFTLLEVTLALAVGVLLLGGLYVAMSTQMYQIRAGREIAEQNALARAILNRISNDIMSQLAPIDPRVLGSSLTEEITTLFDMGEDSDEDEEASSEDPEPETMEEMPGSEGTALFNLGIQGDETHLVLYVSQAPKEADGSMADLRRVSYWLAWGPDGPLGLARYEAKLATSPEGLSVHVPEDPLPYLMAQEVVDLHFEYFDGLMWQPSWDGTIPLEDGKTPAGPPAAIAITLTIVNVAEMNLGMPIRQSTVRQVVFLPTSNGLGGDFGGLFP